MRRTSLRTTSGPFGKRRGSAIVESALCFAAFIFITFGIMEFTLAIYAYNFCTYAAQDAVRWASTRGANYPSPATENDVQQHVRSQAIGLTNTVTVTTTWTPDNKPGGIVRVNVQYSVIPLTGITLHTNLQLSRTAQTIISN